MGLKTRMALAIAALFGLLFAVMMAVVYYFIATGQITGIFILIIPLAFTILILLAQWGISPFILKWIYKIRWLKPEEFDKDIAQFLQRTCSEKGIKVPKFGIVEDDNPNAFAFGWTKNRAHIVLTRGILKYCDPDERKAVMAHELGHVAHSDFITMTVVASVPILFYVIFRSSLYMLRYPQGGGRNRGNILLAVVAVAIFSYIIYLLSNLIALLIGRYREYYADSFSAETTRNPNALSSALMTIAYGLAKEGLGDRSEREHYRYENALMIFNSKVARALASSSATRKGGVNKEAMKRIMAWDLWNPWAFFLELGMTHPLPAKRILALGERAKELGHLPFITFDLRKPESYWDEFLGDIFARASWLLSFPIAYGVLYFGGSIQMVLGAFFLALGAFLFLYWKLYKYPGNFRDGRVIDLLQDPKASPIRGKAARLRGKIIGRGQPGLFFSEDLKLDDGTGLLLLDYHQVLRFIDFLVGVFATEEKIGKEVVVEGWYRRLVIPYLEIYKMHVDQRVQKTYTAGVKVAISLFILILGALITLLSWAAL